jgi:hypothetical protein
MYSYFNSIGVDVQIMEDFTASQMDDIMLNEARIVYVALWSYPQIDLALVLNRYMNVEFFGYEPLIDHLKLPKWRSPDNRWILKGLANYPKYFDNFKHILLSDCDMHLNAFDGITYPVFTSYGCPKKCSFCPSSVNCKRKVLFLPTDQVLELLRFLKSKTLGKVNIHFTDEDFFLRPDRTYDILTNCSADDYNFIALGSCSSLTHFIKKYGNDILKDSGIKLLEVGLETGSDEIASKMGKGSRKDYEDLHKLVDHKTELFWLTMTFHPGETIGTLNETGNFLRKYGQKPQNLYGRIRTNSTVGGLGQFFQYYHGTGAKPSGLVLSERPIRLLPSFVPDSFLNSKIEKVNKNRSSHFYWFGLYGTDVRSLTFEVGQTILEVINSRANKFLTTGDIVTILAVASRLGVIQ